MPAETTDDSLLDGRVRLRQPAQGYRAAIDPVFLAAAVPARAGERVLDAGAGVGAAALCLATRVGGCQVVGLEVQPDLAELARDNIRRNGLEGRVEVLTGDVLAPPPRLAPGSFHHVMTNPPHLQADRTVPPPEAAKARAHVEEGADLDAWIRFCVNMLRAKGTLTVIHRADRLDDLLAALRGRVGEITLLPLWPKSGRPAKRLLVRARKGVATPLALVPGLVLHEEDGAYTRVADAVLRRGAGLE